MLLVIKDLLKGPRFPCQEADPDAAVPPPSLSAAAATSDSHAAGTSAPST